MNYLYCGPASGVTLADGAEVLLWPGKAVALPEDHEYVKTLVALDYLKPLPDSFATAATGTTGVNDGR
ncbi:MULTISPECIES: hypothetical protein [unclassified Serratia (in: enterobacteria)]|jgi:hypothetical protein|uniref:hypothetical protein n=1 Tax=unclassified Serratia (in: enterobacteria) TaxID=2647522 RepID=UPI0005025139|nr:MULTISPECIES: hypothetical protein [unclassified Serratia (in: enterobacteria)]KFK91715.1 hypothetical protein JV45_24785 [Serratia sp. Ag2]KFK98576.1 hypothetical protein IV04_12015 [Serratia sp. Ag1]